MDRPDIKLDFKNIISVFLRRLYYDILIFKHVTSMSMKNAHLSVLYTQIVYVNRRPDGESENKYYADAVLIII